jgi:hypothetical protein
MNEYTASNGVSLQVDRYEDLRIRGAGGRTWHMVTNVEGAKALREFFRAEEDERLGRWRWPENPDYVVYPGSLSMREAQVVSEEKGCWGQWSEAEARRDARRDRLAAAAVAYFDAHPEPKPWHEAKPGEVWLLTFTGFETGGSSPWTVRPGRLSTDPAEFVYPQNGNTLALNDPEIVAARRIWPEDAS